MRGNVSPPRLAVGREPLLELREQCSSFVVAQHGLDPAEVAVLGRELSPVRSRIRRGAAAVQEYRIDVDEPGRPVCRSRFLQIAQLPERPRERRPLRT